MGSSEGSQEMRSNGNLPWLMWYDDVFVLLLHFYSSHCPNPLILYQVDPHKLLAQKTLFWIPLWEMNWKIKVKIKDTPSKGPSPSCRLYWRSLVPFIPTLGPELRKSSLLVCTTSNWMLNFSFSFPSIFFFVLFLRQALNLYWLQTLHVDQTGLKLVNFLGLPLKLYRCVPPCQTPLHFYLTHYFPNTSTYLFLLSEWPSQNTACFG